MNKCLQRIGEVFKESGLSTGFGFVAMANATEAYRAIAELGGRLVAGCNLVVREAGVKEPQKPLNERNIFEVLLYKDESKTIKDQKMEVVDK